MRKTYVLLLMGLVLACSPAKEQNAEEESNAIKKLSDSKSEAVRVSKNPKQINEAEILADTGDLTREEQALVDSISTEMGPFKQELKQLSQVNDTISYGVLLRSNEVCTYYFIASLLHDTLLEEIEIGAACETDGPQAEMSWVAPIESDSSGLSWLEIYEYLPDTLLNDEGEAVLPQGTTINDIEKERDTTYYFYEVNELGRITVLTKG